MDKTDKFRNKQKKNGTFTKGNPGGGRKPMTEEEKIRKRAIREYVEEYKQGLAESLPMISPILIAKAMSGDVSAIKEINDRVIGKAQQSIDMTSKGNELKQVMVKFIDGDSTHN